MKEFAAERASEIDRESEERRLAAFRKSAGLLDLLDSTPGFPLQSNESDLQDALVSAMT